VSDRFITLTPVTAFAASADPVAGIQMLRQPAVHLIIPPASWSAKYSVLPDESTSVWPTPSTFFTETTAPLAAGALPAAGCELPLLLLPHAASVSMPTVAPSNNFQCFIG
jgi:hypothetical protein